MKISILTPSFNSGKYLERAIQSVLQQDYTNWEHIVMDGGSTDETLYILKKYPHIKWKSEKDQGQSDAMNKAFDLCIGDIIVYLNADDYFLEGAFSGVINFFDKNNVDMVVGNGRYLESTGFTQDWYPATSYRKILLHFKYKFPSNPVTYFYKKHVQQKIGGFNINNHYTMDYEFLLHVFKRFKIGKIEQLLGVFFGDGNNKTATINPRAKCKETALAFTKEHDKIGYYWYSIHHFFHVIRIKVQHKLGIKKFIKV